MASREWKWTKARLRAAQLLAEDELSDEKIASSVGVTRNTIAMWKLNPIFAARVHSLVATWERKIMRSGIANKARRLHVLNHFYNLQMRIIEERARENTAAGDFVPGKATGLIVTRRKVIRRAGGETIIVEKAEFDHALSREVRATLDQAARETGQLVEKHEVSGGDGTALTISVEFLDDIVLRVETAAERDSGIR